MNTLKIKFDNSFYFFLLLILLTGLFKQFTFVFILLFFHELGHALMGIIFKWKIVSITFYPYGGLTKFSSLENRSIKEELIILISGPIFQIITYLIINIFFKYDYIYNYHLSIILFNMLPIINLDGGKILNLLLNKIFNYLNSFYISIFISFLTIIFLILFCIFYYNNLNLFLLILLLIFKVINCIKNIKYYYNKFLLERYLYNFNYNNIKIINNKKSFYREKKHYINFTMEKDYLKKVFNFIEK